MLAPFCPPQIRRMALSTFKGYKAQQEIHRRAEAEGWYDPERANRRRGLKEVTLESSNFIASVQSIDGADCYVGDNVPYL